MPSHRMNSGPRAHDQVAPTYIFRNARPVERPTERPSKRPTSTHPYNRVVWLCIVEWTIFRLCWTRAGRPFGPDARLPLVSVTSYKGTAWIKQ